MLDNHNPVSGFYWIVSKGMGLTLAKFEADTENPLAGSWYVIGLSSPVSHKQLTHHYHLVKKIEPPAQLSEI